MWDSLNGQIIKQLYQVIFVHKEYKINDFKVATISSPHFLVFKLLEYNMKAVNIGEYLKLNG